MSFFHSRWWKAYTGPLYLWSDLKTDYTMVLISPESQSILGVRAALTNERQAFSSSLFVISGVTSTAAIWAKAFCFPFPFKYMSSLSALRLHTLHICQWDVEPGKMQGSLVDLWRFNHLPCYNTPRLNICSENVIWVERILRAAVIFRPVGVCEENSGLRV